MSRPLPDPRCARCGKPQTVEFKPFCSAGCKDRDLLDWLDERHRLPGDDVLDNDGDDG